MATFSFSGLMAFSAKEGVQEVEMVLSMLDYGRQCSLHKSQGSGVRLMRFWSGFPTLIAVELWENHSKVSVSSYKVGLAIGFTSKVLPSNKSSSSHGNPFFWIPSSTQLSFLQPSFSSARGAIEQLEWFFWNGKSDNDTHLHRTFSWFPIYSE